MPTALTTSKRKFHTLLDSLTSRPSSSRSSVTSTSSKKSSATTKDAPPPKRPRLSPRSSLASSHPLSDPDALRTIDRASTPNNDTNGLKINPRTASILKRKEEERRAQLKEEAQYNPWSSEGFLKRLKTFSDLTVWTPGKPDAINEVVWSKRGWTCDGINRVACKRGCEARVVVSLRPKRKDAEGKDIEGTEDFGGDVSEELVQRYEALVVEGHHEGCLWRVGRACADDIYRVGVVRGEQWQRELRERYLSFQVKESLPNKTRLECPIDVEQTARYLEPDFFSETSAAPDQTLEPAINTAALALALTGWQIPPSTSAATSTATPTATCHSCFRRIGLWLYTRPPSPEEDQPMTLDLLTSHRHYCPWTSPTSQAMPLGTFEGLPAYDVLQRVIAAWAGVRARARKSGARPPGRMSMGQSGVDEERSIGEVDADGAGEGELRPVTAKSREERNEEDRKRFQRLRELTRMMGLNRKRKETGVMSAGGARGAGANARTSDAVTEVVGSEGLAQAEANGTAA